MSPSAVLFVLAAVVLAVCALLIRRHQESAWQAIATVVFVAALAIALGWYATTAWIFVCVAVLLAAGLWLALPRGGKPGRERGLMLVLGSVALLATQLPPFGGALGMSVFYILAAMTVLSAVCAVSFRSPMYCAIWFAMTLAGVGGLFLFQGAQFLAVATLTVYAGAILVTLLFVLMLAQSEGRTVYDRLSWEGWLSACTAAAMIGVLTWTLTAANAEAIEAGELLGAEQAQLETELLAPEHVAHLGKALFSRHLIALEVAGLLLFIALVGAVAVTSTEKHLKESYEDRRSSEQAGTLR